MMRRVSPLPRSLPKNFAAELLFGRSKTSCVLMRRRATPLSICPRSHAPAWERFIGRSASYRQADGEAQPSDAERRGPMFPRGSVGTSLSSPRAKCLTALPATQSCPIPKGQLRLISLILDLAATTRKQVSVSRLKSGSKASTGLTVQLPAQSRADKFFGIAHGC